MSVDSAEQCSIPTNIMVFNKRVFDTGYHHVFILDLCASHTIIAFSPLTS